MLRQERPLTLATRFHTDSGTNRVVEKPYFHGRIVGHEREVLDEKNDQTVAAVYDRRLFAACRENPAVIDRRYRDRG